jgi:hypothetical protein
VLSPDGRVAVAVGRDTWTSVATGGGGGAGADSTTSIFGAVFEASGATLFAGSGSGGRPTFGGGAACDINAPAALGKPAGTSLSPLSVSNTTAPRPATPNRPASTQGVRERRSGVGDFAASTAVTVRDDGPDTAAAASEPSAALASDSVGATANMADFSRVPASGPALLVTRRSSSASSRAD